MDTDKIPIKTFIYSIITVCSVEFAAALIIRRAGHPLFMIGIARLIEIIILIFIVAQMSKGLYSVGLDRSQIMKGCYRGLIWSGMFGIIAGVIALVMVAFNINPITLIRSKLPHETGRIILLYFVGGFISPVAEEIFFRGILYGFFRKWGIAIALIVSTGVFVLLHLNFSSIPVTQIVGGIVFAIAYEIEKNLIPPIIIHVLGNLAIFTISLC